MQLTYLYKDIPARGKVEDIHRMLPVSQAWQHTTIILALRRLRQEDSKLKGSLGYIARPSKDK
jgi:hypothetical protein